MQVESTRQSHRNTWRLIRPTCKSHTRSLSSAIVYLFIQSEILGPFNKLLTRRINSFALAR